MNPPYPALFDAELMTIRPQDPELTQYVNRPDRLVNHVAPIAHLDAERRQSRVARIVCQALPHVRAALEPIARRPPGDHGRRVTKVRIVRVGGRFYSVARVTVCSGDDGPVLAQEVVQRMRGVKVQIPGRRHDAIDLGDLARARVET